MTVEPRPPALGTTLSALTEDDLGSPAQRDRRRRILDATMALASKGGFDAVQMRAVAERGDVALGTLYRYFPSKIHLLVTALIREFGRAQEKLERSPIPGDTQASVTDHVRSTVNNDRISVEPFPGNTDPPPVTGTASPSFQMFNGWARSLCQPELGIFS